MTKKYTKDLRLVPALMLNLAVVVLGLIGTAMSFKSDGWGLFRYYTLDSNVVCLAACGVMAVYLIRKMLAGNEIPRWAFVFKYVGVCVTTVTFVVVITVLAPPMGKEGYAIMLFKGSMLYHHFLCPVLAFISFMAFDRLQLSPRKAAGIAIIPTALYALVTVILNILKVMEGPYPFLYVYEQPWWMSVVWCILIVGGAYAFAYLVARIKKH